MSVNAPLLSALGAWFLAQVIKLPVEYWQTNEWRWHLLLSPGGMPSSHAALVCGLAWTIGLANGFTSSVFAVTFILAMVVIYDAMGVRRAAGEHARVINRMIKDLARGHPLKQEELRELLGHTPRQILSGIVFGVLVSWVFWLWLS